MKKLILLSIVFLSSLYCFAQSEAVVIKREAQAPLKAGISGTTARTVYEMPLSAGISGTTSDKNANVPLGAGSSGTTSDRNANVPLGAGSSGTTTVVFFYEIIDVLTGEIFSTLPIKAQLAIGKHVLYVK